MAKKIPFKVVFASDEDSDYPASELNSHSPTVHGWRSNSSSPVTPKEIVLRFFNPARIYRIQVLAHQHYIPERIELWLHYSSKSAPSTPSSQSFEYMGFVALSDNSSTNYTSRELQSVAVAPKVGSHLKLRLGPPHSNKFNAENQVALLAINILGEELTPEELAAIQSNTALLSATPANIETLNSSLASVCDDLSYSMYVEESICDVVRRMELLKVQAVQGERFEYARKLKLCMTVLRTAGERLGRYALAKRQAVQQEDFTTARLRKEQIEMYRKAVFNQLKVDTLLRSDKSVTSNDSCSELYASKPMLPSPPSLQDVASALSETALPTVVEVASRQPQQQQQQQPPNPTDTTDSTNTTTSSTASSSGAAAANRLHEATASSKSQHNLSRPEDIPNSPLLSHKGRSPMRSPTNTGTGSLRRRNKSAPRNSYEDYDERAISTAGSHSNDFLRECQSALLESETGRVRSKLNERERRQAALPILIFGMELVELIYSRQYTDREEGLVRLRSILKREGDEDQSAGPNKICRSATLLLHRGVRDAVFSVFSQATESVRSLFMEFVPNRVSPSEVARSVDRLLPELLSKSGDPSARVHTLAQHTILSIAACQEVRDQHLIAPALSRPVGNGTHPRLALSRMQMLEQLVLSQGISSDKQSGLACRTLSEAGCSGIHHPAESVRKVAERVLLLVYKVNPRLVRKQLPPDDDITRRNLLYRQLFTEFDKIDLQRKKEMLENKHFSGPTSFAGICSPPMSNSSKNSPPVEIRSRALRYDSAGSSGGTRGGNVSFSDGTHFGWHSNFNSSLQDSNLSPVRRPADSAGIIKSKSGHAIGHHHWASEDKCESSFYEKPDCNGKTTLEEGGGGPKQTLSQPKTLLYDSTVGFLGSENGAGSRKSSNSDSFEGIDNEIRCPFCDWICHGDPAQLDKHYWKACPVLTKCPQCSQILEVAALSPHLINECEAKASYVSCERCTESVHKDLYEYHMMEDFCRELTTGAARCPLCHDDVLLPLDGGWKRHLLSRSGCLGNSRRRAKV